MPIARFASVLTLAAALTGCVVVIPGSDGTSGDPAQVRLGSARANATDRAALRAVNVARANAGLAPLRFDARLQSAAKSHSNWMARTGRHSHFGAGGSNVATRVKVAGYCYRQAAENIGYGHPTPDHVVRGWMGSPPHRAAIHDRSARDAAVAATRGNDTIWWTLVIGSPC